MKKYVYLFACVWCMMLSCTHEDPNNSGTGTSQRVEEWQDSTLSGDAVIGFSVGSVMSVERQGCTRSTAAYDGTCAFSEGDRIAIRVSRNSVVEDVKLYEVQSDGSLECLDTYPFTWRSLSDAVDIQAWSYGDASTTTAAPEDSDYSLEINQQSNGYKELLYCNAPGTGYSANSITLNFYHQLARMVFNVNHDATGTLSISSQTVGNTTSFPKTAVFSVPTGNNTVGTWNFSASTYGTIIPKTESTQTGYQATYSAVIFPKTYAKSTQFFTVNNSDGDYVYNISETAGFTPTAGNQYNYTVTVKDGTEPYDAKIEYLEGTGTQWINSGTQFTTDNNCGIDIKWMPTDVNSYRSVIGSCTSNDNSWFVMFGCGGAIYIAGSSGLFVNSIAANVLYTASYRTNTSKNITQTLNGVSTTKTYSGTIVSGCNIGIFEQLKGGSNFNRFFIGRIYYLKIYNNNTLVRDFIPVRVGQVGYLYDKVSQDLFGNSGTGSFVLGPDV